MLNFTNYANPDGVLFNLLKHYNLSFNAEEVSQELNFHPDYPSLLALNDVAINFGLPCNAYQIGKEDLQDVPVPFIAHSKNYGSEFTMVTKIEKDKIVVNSGSGKKSIPLTDFEKKFTGAVLIADDENGQNINNQAVPLLTKLSGSFPQIISLALLGLIVLSGVFLYFNNITNFSWPALFLLLFKSTGLAVSILLLVQSIDQNNPLIQRLCGGEHKSDCNAILSSKAATVFKGLSWSEVGFFYFAGTWLSLLFSGGNTITYLILAGLNLLSLPYTFYSVYYQAKVAKQWCKLCCAVQALLWLEFFSFLSFNSNLFNVNIANLSTSVLTTTVTELLICLALPVTLWLMLKPLLLKAKQAKVLKNQLRKLKYNKESFDQLLLAQPKYATPNADWSIVLGNTASANIITMVSNPYCPPCAKTHQILDDWLNKNHNLQIRLVFTANNTETDIKTPVVRHLMALNRRSERQVVKKALQDWYEQKQKSYQEWAKLYPTEIAESEHDKLNEQNNWCQLAEIKATPTFLLNGYRLPESYQLKDIKYLLN